MRKIEYFTAILILLPILAGGCGRTQTAVNPPSNDTVNTSQPENVQSPADSGAAASAASQAAVDNSSAEQQTSADNQMQGSLPAASQVPGDIASQNLDSRLQDALRNFHATASKIDRSTMASDIAKLADVGVPKPQIASALGYLFRDENSVEVKSDILNELGDLEEPSAYDQIVQGLDQRQPDEVRVAAIEALDSLGDKRALPILQPLLTDRDEDVRDAAQSATDSLKDQ
jgi:HEAT repeat protein